MKKPRLGQLKKKQNVFHFLVHINCRAAIIPD